MKELFPDLNAAELRAKFLEEVPQTPVEEIAEEGALEEEPADEVATNASTAELQSFIQLLP